MREKVARHIVSSPFSPFPCKVAENKRMHSSLAASQR